MLTRIPRQVNPSPGLKSMINEESPLKFIFKYHPSQTFSPRVKYNWSMVWSLTYLQAVCWRRCVLHPQLQLFQLKPWPLEILDEKNNNQSLCLTAAGS